MRIRDTRVIVASPGPKFFMLKIETDAGMSGIGHAWLSSGKPSIVRLQAGTMWNG